MYGAIIRYTEIQISFSLNNIHIGTHSPFFKEMTIRSSYNEELCLTMQLSSRIYTPRYQIV